MYGRNARRLVVTCAPATAFLLIYAAVSDAAVEVRHSLGGRFRAGLTRAYQECTVPSNMSSDGIPACDPPVTSACDCWGSVEFKNAGTNPPAVSVRVDADVGGPDPCETGDYSMQFDLRITTDDDGCATGQCTWIDAPLSVVLSGDGSRRDTEFTVEEVIALLGLTVGHVANYEILGVTIQAPDDLPVAAVGVGYGSDQVTSFATVAYETCQLPDTATSSGAPACSAPTWASGCDFTRGLIEVDDAGDVDPSVPTFGVDFTRSGTAASCADGTYELAATVRLTGALCFLGAPCTYVDTEAVLTFDAVAGNLIGVASLATAGLAGPFDTIEIRNLVLRDPAGQGFASPGASNSFKLDRARMTVKLRDPANSADDALVLRSKILHADIDPTLGGATFAVTDRNGTVYSVTIPGSAWETVKDDSIWRYRDDTGALGGVYKAMVKHTAAGDKTFRLKAQNIDLSSANLPMANLVVTSGNSEAPGDAIAQRNLSCAHGPHGARCKD